MPGLFEIANEIAVRYGGRNPEWAEQGSPASTTAVPSGATDGIALKDSVVALLSVELDGASSVDFVIWFYANGAWFAPEGGEYTGITANWIERLETGGMDRVYVQMTTSDGTVNIGVGPCLKEG